MTTDQLSIQLTAINDAVQILARNQVTVEHHSNSIDGLLQKNKDYDVRIRDIENLIHQSCDIKSKEISDIAKRVHDRIDEVGKDSKSTSFMYSAVVAGIGLVLFGLVWQTDDAQDAKNDKIYQEIFGTLRDVNKNISEIKENLAVITTNQKHYQNELHDHMKHEEGN